jgi:hypothetical protein
VKDNDLVLYLRYNVVVKEIVNNENVFYDEATGNEATENVICNDFLEKE